MQALVCDLCGGKLVMGTGGTATCDSCGMSYSMERMKEKIQEIQGIVRIDHSPMIDNYLQMAQTALEADNKGEAETYANKIIEIDPENYQAWLIKGKSAGWQSTLQNPRFFGKCYGFCQSTAICPRRRKRRIGARRQRRNQVHVPGPYLPTGRTLYQMAGQRRNRGFFYRISPKF